MAGVATAFKGIGKSLGPVLAGGAIGKAGSVDRITLIVRGGRVLYLTSIGGISVLWYAGYRNKKIDRGVWDAGSPQFPFPGSARARSLANRFRPDRPDSDRTKSGYQLPSTKSSSAAAKQMATTTSGGQNVNTSGAGEWGSSETSARSVMQQAGIPESMWTSTKRDIQNTASGGVSDHWTGCKQCFAIDWWAGSQDATTKKVMSLMKVLGVHYTGGPVNWVSVERGGYRFQVGWLVADHYDHCHMGVRKIGYSV